jgi:hypothetical protein
MLTPENITPESPTISTGKPYMEKDALLLLMKYQMPFENVTLSREEFLNKVTRLIINELQETNQEYKEALMVELTKIVDGGREHLELIVWLVILYETELEKDISNEEMQTFEATLEGIKNSSIPT